MAKITSKDILAQMQEQYAQGGYKKKTDEELKQQAQSEFNAYYDAQRLGAQQQFERNDLALQQQKAALDYAFQKQQEAAEKEYNKVYSQADRQLLSRGMQRSSYGAQTLANLRQQQADVYMDLENQLAAKGNDIEAQRVQLGDQYAAQLNQYDAQQAADELNRLRELQEQEYERGVKADAAQNDLALQLYELMKAEEAANKGGGGGGGGGGSKQPEETPATPPKGDGFDALLNALGGSGAKSVGTSGLATLIRSTVLSGAPSTIPVNGPVTQKFINDLNSMSGKKVTTDNARLQQAIDNTNKNGKVFESVLLNDIKKQKK